MGKYESLESRQRLARQLAQESIVLLKNEDRILPLRKDAVVAVLGRCQNDTIIGGSGSGASNAENALQIGAELEKAGLSLQADLKAYYQNVRQRELAEAENSAAESGMDFAGLVASGMIYEIFGQYHGPIAEPMPEAELFKAAGADTDTAILVIGRATGGEECDRRVEDDYYLTAAEKSLVQAAAAHFEKLIVVYNVNGAVDTGWMLEYPKIKAVLFMGTAGEQAAGALADILVGKASPSGKLAQTLALRYEDYPTAEHFSYDKSEKGVIKTYADYGLSAEENGSSGFAVSPVTVYTEDIYVGYRYFDAFEKKVAYPFGFGLTYAEFQIQCTNANITEDTIVLEVKVKNSSKEYVGKEVVQAYVALPNVRLEQPRKQLKAFAKTGLLQPGEEEMTTLTIPIRELVSFDEEQCAYVLEPGNYGIFLGNSVDNVSLVAEMLVPEGQAVQKLRAHIGIAEVNRGKINFLSCGKQNEGNENIDASMQGDFIRLVFSGKLAAEECPKTKQYDFNVKAKKSFLGQVEQGLVSMEEFVNQMTVEELAVLCNGYGPGLPFGGIGQKNPPTIYYEDGSPIGQNTHPSASPGYANAALPKYGIYSTWYKDGPASVGKVAWPTGMMLACSFNEKLLYEFGHACGTEAECMGVDSWLAPGLNLIRNPIEGRAFEYFSEDPLVCGKCGIAIVKGATENNHVTACPKHFALNEQETYRRGSLKKKIDAVDTIATARAIREIYLKPFQMVIEEAKPWTIMTSFNKINGIFAAGNHTLCTEILREEWGYEGVVITDWGDMDYVVDGANAVAAGNDVIMPGGPPVIRQVLAGYEEGRVTLDELRKAVAHLLQYIMRTRSQKDGEQRDCD